MTELKSCPFCGGNAFCESPSYGRGYWYVACDDCRAEGPPSKNGQDCGEAEAIAAWNRRATEQAAHSDEALVEELAKQFVEIAAVLEWQPIEAAPRDGTPIFCCDTTWGQPLPMIVHWGQHESWDDDHHWLCGYKDEWPRGRIKRDPAIMPTPTHWMPLPEPPAMRAEMATPPAPRRL